MWLKPKRNPASVVAMAGGKDDAGDAQNAQSAAEAAPLSHIILEWMDSANYLKSKDIVYDHARIGKDISIDPIVVFLALITDVAAPAMSGTNGITSFTSVAAELLIAANNERVDGKADDENDSMGTDDDDLVDANGGDANASLAPQRLVQTITLLPAFGKRMYSILSEVYSLRRHEAEWEDMTPGQFKVRRGITVTAFILYNTISKI